MSSDAQVFLWNGVTGKPVQTFHVPEASFFLGFPYCLAMHEQRLLISCDEGAILIEFDE